MGHAAPSPPTSPHRRLDHLRPWLLVVLGYSVLAAVLTWPLVLHLDTWLVGTPSPDGMDTSQLRRVVAMGLDAAGRSTELFPPVGYPAGALMPNRLDHLLAVPLVHLLPWPLADNLWWLAILSLNGTAGHLVGHQLGGGHRSGVLCGVALACAEPVLREANLGHAPQSMVFSGALVVLFLARLTGSRGTGRDGIGLGLSMALAGLTYWYFGLFFAVLCLPPVLATLYRSRDSAVLLRLLVAVGLCLVVVAWPLSAALAGWDQLAMTDRTLLPDIARPSLQVLPRTERFLFTQSGGLLWAIEGLPADRSNRLGLALVLAALWGTRAVPVQRWRWWAAAALGGVMLMGPFLAFAGDPVLVGGKPVALPWYALAQLSPTLERLHWPQRWGIVVPLAMLPLLARCPRPLVFAVLLGVETLLVSAHAPLGSLPTPPFDGWRALAALPDDQSVLVLPLRRDPDQTAWLGLAYRAAEQPLIAETRLPAGAQAPDDWWAALDTLGVVDPRATAPITRDALAENTIGAVVLDLTPGGPVHPRDHARLTAHWSARLDTALGPSTDHGSVRVWWVDRPDRLPEPPADPAAWRQEQLDQIHAYDAVLQASDVAGMRFNIPQDKAPR